ncbi:exosortase A-associated hydrolase 1 [Nitrosospira multiformis]|uniref:Exosortase A-associated hydrolase 1 n=1 Tax=Nitrosospira multiformis TaxID=1231 RepID=A0A2T5I5T5_9PROT|nr:hydrolase 1, exosortase A system-associated [Nitrosospira multiformis]PTQ79148.1 exosortase A-associated hydrolase 1 [Nitrosospira multiformis]
MNFREQAFSFPCQGSHLFAILSMPENPSSRGLLIVVGGPQYRVGSHRQFVLLARHLAATGVSVLRFDYRGMGDSDGEARTFENIGDDLRCAIDQFFDKIPSLDEVVIWGLCDAASAALFYAPQDRRVTGLVLLNPWVRTEQGAAQTYLKHYYIERLFAAEFWKKILKGHFNYSDAMKSLMKIVLKALGEKKKNTGTKTPIADDHCHLPPLPERMLDGLRRFRGKLFLIISGRDLTSAEFLDVVKRSTEWQILLTSSLAGRFDLPEANHTFSSHEWRDQVAVRTAEWIRSW